MFLFVWALLDPSVTGPNWKYMYVQSLFKSLYISHYIQLRPSFIQFDTIWDILVNELTLQWCPA